MREVTTTDLSQFGYREWLLLRQLIDAMIDQGLPVEFEQLNVKPMFNKDSGNVFLTNDEFQVAMMNGDTLESWYYCHNCGHEGFADDCQLCEDGCNECKGSEPC